MISTNYQVNIWNTEEEQPRAYPLQVSSIQQALKESEKHYKKGDHLVEVYYKGRLRHCELLQENFPARPIKDILNDFEEITPTIPDSVYYPPEVEIEVEVDEYSFIEESMKREYDRFFDKVPIEDAP